MQHRQTLSSKQYIKYRITETEAEVTETECEENIAVISIGSGNDCNEDMKPFKTFRGLNFIDFRFPLIPSQVRGWMFFGRILGLGYVDKLRRGMSTSAKLPQSNYHMYA